MRDLFHKGGTPERWTARARRFLLDLDSRVDFGIYQARTWGRELYERSCAFHSSQQTWFIAGPAKRTTPNGSIAMSASGSFSEITVS